MKWPDWNCVCAAAGGVLILLALAIFAVPWPATGVTSFGICWRDINTLLGCAGGQWPWVPLALLAVGAWLVIRWLRRR